MAAHLDLVADILLLLLIQAQVLHLQLQVLEPAKAAQVAVEAGRHVGGDDLLGADGQALQQTLVVTEHILLVVVLGVVEGLGRGDPGLDGALQRGLMLLLGFQGQGLLLAVVVEDGRHVLAAGAGRAVVVVPEDGQQRLVVRLGRVVLQLDGLGVVTKAVVRWRLLSASRVANPGSDDPLSAAELRLGEPESAQGKGRLLRRHAGLRPRHRGSWELSRLSESHAM